MNENKSPNTAIAAIKKDTISIVENRIRELQNKSQIDLPKNYSAENALKSAWLILQQTVDLNKKPALDVCTPASIQNALFDMVIQALNPVKKQCYFIVRGNKLCIDRSYFGTVAALKRLKEVKDVFYQIVYKNDEFDYVIEGATKKVTKHIQKIENVDLENIVAAYCVIVMHDNTQYTEIMTWKQILNSWKKSAVKPVDASGNVREGTTHKEFTDQMALRTVINRACKNFVNTSDDSEIIIQAINNTTPNENEVEDVTYRVEEEVAANANKQTIDIPEDEPMQQEPEQQSDSMTDPGF